MRSFLSMFFLAMLVPVVAGAVPVELPVCSGNDPGVTCVASVSRAVGTRGRIYIKKGAATCTLDASVIISGRDSLTEDWHVILTLSLQGVSSRDDVAAFYMYKGSGLANMANCAPFEVMLKNRGANE